MCGSSGNSGWNLSKDCFVKCWRYSTLQKFGIANCEACFMNNAIEKTHDIQHGSKRLFHADNILKGALIKWSVLNVCGQYQLLTATQTHCYIIHCCLLCRINSNMFVLLLCSIETPKLSVLEVSEAELWAEPTNTNLYRPLLCET